MSINRTPDNAHIKRLTSVRLLLLVKPLDPFKLAIKFFSIHRSGETPDQKVLVLLMTDNPLQNSLRIIGLNSVVS